eukprot:PhF_6_TR44150/c1_g2_i3/m.67540
MWKAPPVDSGPSTLLHKPKPDVKLSKQTNKFGGKGTLVVPDMSLDMYTKHMAMDGLLWVPRNVPPPRVVFPLGGTDHALHSERVRTLGVVLEPISNEFDNELLLNRS